MAKRILFGLLLAAIALSLFFVPPLMRYGMISIFMMISHQEMLNAIQAAGYGPIVWPGYVFSIGVFPVYILMDSNAVWVLLLLVIIGAFVQRIFSKKITSLDVFSGLASFLYPLSLFLFLVFAASMSDVIWTTVLLSGVVTACITDTFALFSGMAFGKHPLAPQISPKKTREGAIGGFLFAIVSGVALYYLQSLWKADYSIIRYVGAAMLGSVTGQIGDLVASSIKREANIKDFSKLIPGHGGLLDRLDSILFAIPMAYVFFVMTV